MQKTTTQLADGRDLIYYDRGHDTRDLPPDTRDLPECTGASQMRFDVVTGEWVVVADHRQRRTFQPQAEDCPLCPTRDGRRTEVPASDYDVVVFENRFPALTQEMALSDDDLVRLARARPGPPSGRCEVICFSSQHDASFADLKPDQARLVLDVWIDRTRELMAMPGVVEIFCFENRGPEMGVTQPHPHGQIYAYPFATPRTESMLAQAAAFRETCGRNLFDDLVESESTAGGRVVAANDEWIALVPYAARWPYEVHLYPRRRRPDLRALDESQSEAFPNIYLDLLGRFDRLFSTPAPYVSAWHQAPAHDPRAVEFATHLVLFTSRRSSNRLKVLGGTEVGMDTFSNDVSPEQAAEELCALEA